MPIDYSNYPDDWHEISERIRFDRADGRCECRGECGLDHNEEARWIEINLSVIFDENDPERCAAYDRYPHPVTESRVILTVAHLDHDTTNSDPANLRAYCQRCHNRYDAPHRAASRAETRKRKLIDAGQLSLGLELQGDGDNVSF